MTRIYILLGNLRPKYVAYAKRYSRDKFEIDEVVQELMLYFMNMNPDTLKAIYKKDGEKGLVGYGCVVIRRSLTSPRSPYFYKIDKYYTRISSLYGTHSSQDHKDIKNALENIPNPDDTGVPEFERLEEIDAILDTMYWYDRDVFKLYYYEGNTLDSLAKKTKISRNSLFTTIDNVRNKIKTILNERKEE